MSEEGAQVAADAPAPSPHLREHHFDTERAREAQRKSAETRRRKREEREAKVQLAHLTYRQKVGVAMAESELDDIRAVRDAAYAAAKKGDMRGIHALARLASEAYGAPQQEAPADGRDAEDKAWEEMSPAERAAYRAALIEQVEKERGHSLPAGKSEDPRVTSE